MKIDHEKRTIKFRQSWINDYFLCAERARRGLLEPDVFTSDAEAILGTGVHAYAELRLMGEDRETAMGAALNAVDYELSLPHTNIKRNDESIYSFIPAMCASWERDILPKVKPGGETEVKFEAGLSVWNGYVLLLGGMIDYIEPGGKVWDWKTAGQEYKPWERKRWAVQPTAYAIGATSMGKATYPVQWAYGVVLKSPMKQPKTQIVEFTRDEGHASWLIEQLKSILDQHVNLATPQRVTLGTSRAWLKNDQHALCSEKWCPVFASCKGKHVEI